MNPIPPEPNDFFRTLLVSLKDMPAVFRFIILLLAILAVLWLSDRSVPAEFVPLLYGMLAVGTAVYLVWETQQYRLKQLELSNRQDQKEGAKMAEKPDQDEATDKAVKPANTDKPSNVVVGDGAIAQGENATAVGAGGVLVKGDVSGNIITGNNNRIIQNGEPRDVSVLPAELVGLVDKLTQHFNLTELQALCFRLRISHDQLRGETRSQLAQSLLAYCHRHGRVPELVEVVKALRPLVSWDK